MQPHACKSESVNGQRSVPTTPMMLWRSGTGRSCGRLSAVCNSHCWPIRYQQAKTSQRSHKYSEMNNSNRHNIGGDNKSHPVLKRKPNQLWKWMRLRVMNCAYYEIVGADEIWICIGPITSIVNIMFRWLGPIIKLSLKQYVHCNWDRLLAFSSSGWGELASMIYRAYWLVIWSGLMLYTLAVVWVKISQ